MGLGKSKQSKTSNGNDFGHMHYGSANQHKHAPKNQGNDRYFYVNSPQPNPQWKKPINYVRPEQRQLQQAGKQQQQLHQQRRQQQQQQQHQQHQQHQQQYQKKVLVERNKNYSKAECNVCGHEGHASERCYHRNQTCNICGRLGHLASVCKQKTHHPDSVYKPKTARGNMPSHYIKH